MEISKGFENNRPQTLCRITPGGRRRYLEYLAVLEQVVRDAAVRREAASPPGESDGSWRRREIFLRRSSAMQSTLPDDPELHVAIIMDGNGRWATRARAASRRRPPRRRGRGAARRSRRAQTSAWRRSRCSPSRRDNWQRPAEEVEGLMWLLRRYLRAEARGCVENGARLSVIGRRDRLPGSAPADDPPRRGSDRRRRPTRTCGSRSTTRREKPSPAPPPVWWTPRRPLPASGLSQLSRARVNGRAAPRSIC